MEETEVRDKGNYLSRVVSTLDRIKVPIIVGGTLGLVVGRMFYSRRRVNLVTQPDSHSGDATQKTFYFKPIPDDGVPIEYPAQKFDIDYLTGSVTGVHQLAESVSANDLLSSPLPDINQLPLARSKISLFMIERDSDSREYLGFINCLVNGRIINELLYVNSTNPGIKNSFGRDTADVVNDWGRILFGKTEEEVARRRRHESMGKPWFVFMRDCLVFWDLMRRDFANIAQPTYKPIIVGPEHQVMPVIHWVRHPDGSGAFLYDLLEGQPYEGIIAKVLDDNPTFRQHLLEPVCYNPIIGLWSVGCLSPDVREGWTAQIGYGNGREGTRANGPSQAGVQTIRMAGDLLGSEFIIKAEQRLREV